MISRIVIGASVAAILIITGVWIGTMSDPDLQDLATDTDNIVVIGALVPEESTDRSIQSVQLGIDDFNEYLKEQDQDWQLDVVIEITDTNSENIIEKITALDEQGIDVVIGPDTSAGIQEIKPYIELNDIALISCCSTAPSLAIQDDLVYRVYPDDRTEGRVIANIMHDKGVKALVSLYRGDLWGDELYASATESFISLGGITAEGVRHEPGTREFVASIEMIASQVESLATEHGIDSVGVLLIEFSGDIEFLKAAADHEILKNVRWFGTDINSDLLDDAIGLEFAKTTQYTTVQFAIDNNPTSERVNARILDAVGQEPSVYEYTTYDAVWLVGLAMLESKEYNADAIRQNIIKVSQDHQGAIGPVALNLAGDLIASNYAIFQIIDSQWSLVGKYTLDNDSILWNLDDSLSGTINIGVLLPLDGDLASIGREANQGALLAIDDLNQYLKEHNQDWKIDVVIEDTETKPAVALERLEYLHTIGIDTIIGPGTSESVSHIKEYADTNNMILISCCSTAPVLAIPNDSIYRIIPDDSKQGPAISSIMIEQGIQAYVPLYRDDTWGQGLYKTAVESFVSMGGVVSKPVIYPDDIHNIKDTTKQLSEQVQILVDEYGTDRVGVLFIGFSEGVEFMQESAKYDILADVRWFGSSASANEQGILDDATSTEFALQTEFTTVQFSIEQNSIARRVSDHINDTLGHTPSIYAYTAYDATWLAGLAMLESESSDAMNVRSFITSVSKDHIGALGSIKLNAAGDLTAADYAILGIRDGQWSDIGKYISTNQSILWN